jgi:hypothetical protein
MAAIIMIVNINNSYHYKLTRCVTVALVHVNTDHCVLSAEIHASNVCSVDSDFAAWCPIRSYMYQISFPGEHITNYLLETLLRFGGM